METRTLVFTFPELAVLSAAVRGVPKAKRTNTLERARVLIRNALDGRTAANDEDLYGCCKLREPCGPSYVTETDHMGI